MAKVERGEYKSQDKKESENVKRSETPVIEKEDLKTSVLIMVE